MSAPPSDIPNHPLVQLVDSDGDSVVSGCSFFLNNACSNFQQALYYELGYSTTFTQSCQDQEHLKWFVEYQNNDRARIALRYGPTGQYLAARSGEQQSGMILANTPTIWYVYQGDRPSTCWLATSQVPDAFLHTWDLNGHDGAEVKLFAPKADPGWQNLPYSSYEKGTTGLSWTFQPTPECRQWKQRQKANQQNQQFQQFQHNQQNMQNQQLQSNQSAPSNQPAQSNQAAPQNDEVTAKQREELEALKKQLHETMAKLERVEMAQGDAQQRESQLAAREQSVQQSEAQSKQRKEDDAAREKSIQGSEAQAKQREEDLAAREKRVQQSETQTKQREEQLAAREREAEAAEKRIKASEDPEKAQHLESPQDNDKLKAENQKLQDQLKASSDQIAEVQKQLQQAQQGSSSGRSGSSGLSSKFPPYFSSSFGHSSKFPPGSSGISPPERKLPPQTKPAATIRKTFDPTMMKRYEAGRSAMSTR